MRDNLIILWYYFGWIIPGGVQLFDTELAGDIFWLWCATVMIGAAFFWVGGPVAWLIKKIRQ